MIADSLPKVDWNVFLAKFGEFAEAKFEWLSYILFCQQFNQCYGIFGFKNQVGVEVEPISFESDVIGFQSKFLTVKLAERKDKLKESVRKAKLKNPDLTKLIFYINQDFYESSTVDKKNPQYKTAIENYAQKLGVNVDWMVTSRFEYQLSKPQNHWLLNDCFSLNKSILETVKSLNEQFEESYGSHLINDQLIPRAETQEIIEDASSHPITIVHGSAGYGKSGVAYELIQK